MISELHNLANIIIGLSKQSYFDYYRLIVLNPDESYKILLTKNEETIAPVKISLSRTVEYRINTGQYNLLINKEDGTIKKVYQENITVTSNMLGTVRNINV